MKSDNRLDLPYTDFVMYIVAGMRDTLRYVDSESWCGHILGDIKQLREWCEQNDAVDHLDIIDELARDVGVMMMEMAVAWFVERESATPASDIDRKSSDVIH